MGAFSSYPYRRLADALHQAAPGLQPEVRQVGRRAYQLGVQVLPSELMIVELRRGAGWWAMSYFIDPETGQPSEDPVALMRGVNSEHPIPAQAHELNEVAEHVLQLAHQSWQRVLYAPGGTGKDYYWAVLGMKALKEHDART